MKGRVIICYDDQNCLPEIKLFLRDLGIDCMKSVKVDATYYGREELRKVVGGRSITWPIVFFNEDPITWDALKDVTNGYLKRMVDKIKNDNPPYSWPHDPPIKIKRKNILRGIGVGVVVCTTAVVTAPFVLSAVGFTSAGVGAGTIAAVIQSAFYGGATMGVFSALQSAGAVGIGVGANVVIGGTAGFIGKAVHDKLSGDNNDGQPGDDNNGPPRDNKHQEDIESKKIPKKIPSESSDEGKTHDEKKKH